MPFTSGPRLPAVLWACEDARQYWFVWLQNRSKNSVPQLLCCKFKHHFPGCWLHEVYLNKLENSRTDTGQIHTLFSLPILCRSWGTEKIKCAYAQKHKLPHHSSNNSPSCLFNNHFLMFLFVRAAFDSVPCPLSVREVRVSTFVP